MKLDPDPRIEAGPNFMSSLKDILRKAAQVVNPIVDTVATIKGYFVSGVLGVANGGTGASTAAAARANLGAVAKAGDTMTGSLAISVTGGAAALVLNTSNMTTHGNVILSQDGSFNRWAIEPGSAGGSNFVISRYPGGTYADSPISIAYSTGVITLGTAVNCSSTIFSSSSISALGGFRCRPGIGGTATANVFNYNWTGSALQVWVDGTNIGNMSVTSDERVKHDIRPLAADRAAYLAIKPISFRFRDIGVFEDTPGDAGEYWGFSAQNLLDAKFHKAVHGSPTAELEDGTPQPMNVQDRPILAQTVLQVQQLIAITESQAQLIAELRAELDILKGA